MDLTSWVWTAFFSSVTLHVPRWERCRIRSRAYCLFFILRNSKKTSSPATYQTPNVRPLRCPCCCHCRAPACPRASPFLRTLAARPASPCPCYCAKLRAVAICPARTPGYLANLLEKTDSLILMSYCSLYQCSVISRNILLLFTYLLTYLCTYNFRNNICL